MLAALSGPLSTANNRRQMTEYAEVRSRMLASCLLDDTCVLVHNASRTAPATLKTIDAIRNAANCQLVSSNVASTIANETAELSNGRANAKKIELGPPWASLCRSASAIP